MNIYNVSKTPFSKLLAPAVMYNVVGNACIDKGRLEPAMVNCGVISETNSFLHHFPNSLEYETGSEKRRLGEWGGRPGQQQAITRRLWSSSGAVTIAESG